MSIRRLALVALLVAGCSSGLSDTGLVGTWQSTDGRVSVFSLRERESGYAFRWSQRGESSTIQCNDEGVCEQFVEGQKRYQYVFTVEAGGNDREVRVECNGSSDDGTTPPMQYVDRLVAQPGGQEIWAYTIERNGETLERPEPPRKYIKTADEPF